jgi:serine/threonine protein kinase
VLATVAYTAREVLAGEPFDRRADLSSLGCTLFRLLTGKTPFAGAQGMAAVVMMMAHLQTPPPRVTDLMPSLPAALDWVVATAMAEDPTALPLDRRAGGRRCCRAARHQQRDRRADAGGAEHSGQLLPAGAGQQPLMVAASRRPAHDAGPAQFANSIQAARAATAGNRRRG